MTKKNSTKSARESNSATDLALDLQSFLRLCKASEIKVATLAKWTGHNKRYFWGLAHGRGAFNQALLNDLKVRFDVPDYLLNCNANPRAGVFHKSQTNVLGEFHQRFKNAKSVITITKAIDSYLIEDEEEALKWFNTDVLDVKNWEEHKKLYLPYVKEQRAARKKSNMVHRIITPLNLWSRAAQEKSEWLAAARHSISEYESYTAVQIARNWSDLSNAIRELVATFSPTWEKLCFVDHEYLLVHLNDQHYYVVLDPKKVQEYERYLGIVVQNGEPDKPGFDEELSTSIVESITQATVDQMNDLLKRASQDRHRLPSSSRGLRR